MKRGKTYQRPKYRVALKLDMDYDADLVTWIQSLPIGNRSEAMRQAMRAGLRSAQKAEATTLDAIRSAVAEEVTKAIAGRTIKSPAPPDEATTADAEAQYGDKLNRMLGGLHRRSQPPEERD